MPGDVGKMHVHVVKSSAGQADVFVVVRGDPDVVLEGISAVENDGRLRLTFPPLAEWSPALSWLPARIKARIADGVFHERVLAAVRTRWDARASG
jgi:hypothetical protein